MKAAVLAKTNEAQSPGKARKATRAFSGEMMIGDPNSVFEREADRLADAVMAGRTLGDWSFGKMNVGTPLQRKCACGASSEAGNECEGCKVNGTLQRRATDSATPSTVPSIVHQVLRSPGQPLDASTRAFFEPRFRYDFGKVRVHTDGPAQISAAAVNARAYTVGTRIVLGKGAPTSTTEGYRLLAHELAHVVQQGFAARSAGDLTVSNDAAAERQAHDAAGQAASGRRVGKLSGSPAAALQREEAPKPAAAELGLIEKGLVEVAAAPALAMGETVHAMVKATLRGFLVEVKTQAPARGEQLWNHVKEALEHPTEIGSFLLSYWWGLVKGVFSPITGLFDMAKLVGKLGFVGEQILATAWKRREELAVDVASLGKDLAELGSRARDAIASFRQNKLAAVTALGPWFSSLGNAAVSKAEEGGHAAGAALIEQVGKPLPELGETAGEVTGSLLINLILLVFTDGLGNAITQVATKLGEFGSFLGKFGKAAEMIGRIAAEAGDILATIGSWIGKAEAAFAKVAETVLKPIAPLLEELGKLMSGLRSFLRKLLGVSEEAAAGATEELAGATAKAVEEHVPSPASKPSPRPTVNAATAADRGAETAGSQALGKPSRPLGVKAEPVTPATPQGAEGVGNKATPMHPTPSAVTPKPPLASRAKVFEGISEETEQLLAQRPGLARALEQHPEAADLFKLCKSHCFPDFMTDEEIAERLIRVERMQKTAAQYGIGFDRQSTKALLHGQGTLAEVDATLARMESSLQGKILKIHSPGAAANRPPATRGAARSHAVDPSGHETGPQLEKRLLTADEKLKPSESLENFSLREPIKKGEPYNSFKRIADELETRNAELAAQGKSVLKLNPELLDTNAEEFIMSDPELKTEWDRMQLVMAGRENPAIPASKAYQGLPSRYKFMRDEAFADMKREMPRFAKGKMAAKRPDNVDFFLGQDRAVVTDISLKKNMPWHSFKTQVYRKYLGELTGLKVGAVDMTGAVGEMPRITPE